MTRGRWMLGVMAAALALGVVACRVTETPETPPSAPHAEFPIAGGHLRLGCEGCHVASVSEQGLSDVADEIGWVTGLSVECLDCHRDTTAEIFPNGHKNGASCASAGGCHSVSDFCWSQVRTSCGDPNDTAPPPPAGHVDELGERFPLEGPHTIDNITITGCATCHTGQSDSEQLGGSNFCSDCHTRPSETHYPPERPEASDRERGCKSCHASHTPNGKLQVPADWGSTAVIHDFMVPHQVVEDWDAIDRVLQDESLWVIGCDNCHTQPGQYATYDCSSCHPPAELSLINPTHDTTTANCDQCHASGT